MERCEHPDCLYRSVKCDCCIYILIRGQRRPCPAGDCDGVYVSRYGRRGYNEGWMAGPPITLAQENELWCHYLAGLDDREIAAKIGTSAGRIIIWRRENQLPANVRRVKNGFDDNGLPEQTDPERERTNSDMGGIGPTVTDAG